MAFFAKTNTYSNPIYGAFAGFFAGAYSAYRYNNAINNPCPRNAKIQQIRKGHLDSPMEEVQRLKNANLITEADLCRIDRMFWKSKDSLFGRARLSHHEKALVFSLYTQAFAIKNALKDTHYVFFHAQRTELMIIPYVLTEIFKTKDIHDFKFLYVPQNPDSEGILRYTERRENAVLGSRTPPPRESPYSYDTDRGDCRQVLSADGFLSNTEPGESAYDYLVHNNNSSAVKHVIFEAFLKVHPNPFPYHVQFVDDFEKLLGAIPSTPKSSIGNLFAICIPKEKVGEIVYRSHPGQWGCCCHAKEQDLQILEDLQKGLLNPRTQCKNHNISIINAISDRPGMRELMPCPPCPQFRIYTPRLQPNEGIFIYGLSPLPKETRRQLKKEARALISMWKPPIRESRADVAIECPIKKLQRLLA
jgi:hypothetical protein